MGIPRTLGATLSSRAVTRPIAMLTVVVGGALLWSQVTTQTPDTELAATLPDTDFQNVEFLAAPSAHPELRRALDAACAETGCDAPLIGSMVIATANTMSAANLRVALDAQVNLLNRMTPEVEAATDADKARALRLQWEAEAQIADLYRAELQSRANVN